MLTIDVTLSDAQVARLQAAWPLVFDPGEFPPTVANLRKHLFRTLATIVQNGERIAAEAARPQPEPFEP